MVRTISIRALEHRLAACVRDVAGGAVLLVTDPGRVVAEIRQPVLGPQALRVAGSRRHRHVERGLLRPRLPIDPQAYRVPAAVRRPAKVVDAALEGKRGGRG